MSRLAGTFLPAHSSQLIPGGVLSVREKFHRATSSTLSAFATRKTCECSLPLVAKRVEGEPEPASTPVSSQIQRLALAVPDQVHQIGTHTSTARRHHSCGHHQRSCAPRVLSRRGASRDPPHSPQK